MFKIRRFCVSLTMISAICFVIGFSAASLAAQRSGQTTNRILLTKDARSNGYKITVNGTRTYLQAVNVVDPGTEKLLELISELEFRCRQSEQKIKKSVKFEKGNMQPLLIPCEDVDGEAVTVLVVNKLSFVPLVKDADENGYKTTGEGASIFVEATNVKDPSDGKPVNGEKDLETRCAVGGLPIIKRLRFSNGTSNRAKIECLILISPRIIIQDEPN